MSDDDFIYVKKKQFYRIILTVLILVLYAIEGKTVGPSAVEEYIHFVIQFLALGYSFYIVFLLVGLKWREIKKAADDGKKDYKL